MRSADIPYHVLTYRYSLRRFANGARGLFGVPIYLCGSALRPDNQQPRDWDIRLCLTDVDFALRYGNGRETAHVIGCWMTEGGDGVWTGIRWRWSDDCVHWSKRGCESTLLNIDFQVYPEKHWNMLYAEAPRLQIDTRDGDLLEAAIAERKAA